MELHEEKVLQFLPWAKHFARLCSAKLPPHLDHEDLQAAAILGYLRAASRYNVARGASFRGYCAARIRGAVLDEVRKWDSAPRSVHRNQRRITRVTAKLSVSLEREPTPHELADALGIDAEDLAAFQTDAKPHQLIPFDEAGENYNGEDGITLAERLPDPNVSTPDAGVRNDEDRRALLRCINRLPKSQATVIVLHYLEEIPLRQVARMLQVTPSRISQLHRGALQRLKQIWPGALHSA
jgi:RNA polymerase sigma factor for flagellar operon FliA